MSSIRKMRIYMDKVSNEKPFLGFLLGCLAYLAIIFSVGAIVALAFLVILVLGFFSMPLMGMAVASLVVGGVLVVAIKRLFF